MRLRQEKEPPFWIFWHRIRPLAALSRPHSGNRRLGQELAASATGCRRDLRHWMRALREPAGHGRADRSRQSTYRQLWFAALLWHPIAICPKKTRSSAGWIDTAPRRNVPRGTGGAPLHAQESLDSSRHRIAGDDLYRLPQGRRELASTWLRQARLRGPLRLELHWHDRSEVPRPSPNSKDRPYRVQKPSSEMCEADDLRP